MHLFHEVAHACSRSTTKTYSTSFSSAVRLLHKDIRQPIYNIYGFVRFADEIVDTFHSYDKQKLLEDYKIETFAAIDRGVSMNPVLHSFQETVNRYAIDLHLIESFFHSMEMDLGKKKYDPALYEEYIFGSAESVGLMCLYVFCEGNVALFESLKSPAQSLGAAFQKVNFLRDIRNDITLLNREYFPNIDFRNFNFQMKDQIESEIAKDFELAYSGIKRLPWKARFGVYVAYKYYYSLFKKIKKVQPAHILQARVRIPNYRKALIVMRASVKNQLRLI